MSITIVLVAEVLYPSSDNTYLTANSYIVEKGNMQQLDDSTKDFRGKVETDGFKIINFLAYIVPEKTSENQSLVKWLEELCLQLEEPEKPIFRTDYSKGLADGATDTQKLIAKKIRYAIEQEKTRLAKR